MLGWAYVRRSLTAIMLVLLGCAAPSIASAQAGMVGTPVAFCVQPATTVGMPHDLAVARGLARCERDQRSLGPGNFWAISEPINRTSQATDPMVVRMSSVWQREITLDVRYADGHVARMRVDADRMSRYIQLGAVVQLPIPPRTSPVERIAMRIDGSANMRGVVVGPRIATQDAGDRANLLMGVIYAAFVGLAFSLLVYNLALWVALRHRFQLAYCAMVAALLAYCLTSSGALAWAWPDIVNTDRIRLNYLSLGLAAAAALLFARTFFEHAIFRGWLGTATSGAIASLVAGSVGFALFAPAAVQALDRVYSLTFLGALLVIPVILWRAWRLRSSYLWLFAIAWAAPVSMALARVLHNLGVLGWSFWLDNSTILAMAAEALLSSVAIAYRIHLLSRERDIAVAQEAVARKLADTDPLTGLLNRRAFLDQAIGRIGEQKLLLLDIDHFKAVNETLGHDGGDEVLRVFARVMRLSAPPGALIARLGGEEFAILVDAADALDAEGLLARLRAARMPFDLAVTASVGACHGPLLAEQDWKRLYRCADRALFAAKSGGRDRVHRAETLREAA